jgi:hypothetical protein
MTQGDKNLLTLEELGGFMRGVNYEKSLRGSHCERKRSNPGNMTRLLRRLRLLAMTIRVSRLACVACLFLFSACGSGTTVSSVDGIYPAQSLGELTPLEETIYTEGYAGHLVVFLKNDNVIANEVKQSRIEVIANEVKQSRIEVIANEVKQSREYGGIASSPVAPRNDSIKDYEGEEQFVVPDSLASIPNTYSTAEVKRAVDIPAERLDEMRARLESLSGRKLLDFNLVYHIETTDLDDAVRIMRDLQNNPDVDKVYPARKTYVTSISTVPDLTGHQGYLNADETHGGLNAAAAWSAGASGNGVTLVDIEHEWNFSHEDLNLTWGVDNWVGVMCYPTIATHCIPDLAHGTAVAGIISSLDNGHGTTGFAPQTDLKTDAPGYNLINLVDGIVSTTNHEVPAGSILFVEVQNPGRLSDGSCGGFSELDQYGCVPTSVEPGMFAAFEYLSAAGITVIEGAGNGSVDLGDPATYYSFEVTLFDHDSGSILVGGSQGSNHQKISFSNYGSPVDAYAWAQGVVTTAYPYGGSTGPYYWTPVSGANPPNDDPNAYFTNRFGGTSSATAMVAGAAALVQSYAKDLMGDKRYLMPLKMREILVSTGIAQSGSGGNIGRQPRIDRAMAAVDTFWTSITTAYPELLGTGRLTLSEVLTLRTMGLGLICKDRDFTNSDPACPEEGVFTPGTGIGKPMDFDGDGRADLVSWTNGQWKLDLSTVGSGGDNYGAWDVIVNYPATDSDWVWPYVEDYNSDGRSDFAVYDKQNGIWYIAFTNNSILSTGTWAGWDWEIDYSAEWVDTLEMDEWNSQYSRPVPGDYNDDGWVDIAIACSDGYWRIDHGGADRSNYGVFDRNIRYLTTEQLSQAPGWAYLASTGRQNHTDYKKSIMAFKVPDGLPEEGKIYAYSHPNYDTNLLSTVTTRFGGNDTILSITQFNSTNGLFSLGLKENNSEWRVALRTSTPSYSISDLPPVAIYGGLDCKPITADFDGDNLDDRAVMCPDEWRIAYSSDTYAKSGDGARHVALGYNPAKFTLPGRSYSGGISYSFVQRLISYFKQAYPGEPPVIPVDMASFAMCSSLGGDECH